MAVFAQWRETRTRLVITHQRISGAIKRNGRPEADTIPRIYGFGHSQREVGNFRRCGNHAAITTKVMALLLVQIQSLNSKKNVKWAIKTIGIGNKAWRIMVTISLIVTRNALRMYLYNEKVAALRRRSSAASGIQMHLLSAN